MLYDFLTRKSWRKVYKNQEENSLQATKNGYKKSFGRYASTVGGGGTNNLNSLLTLTYSIYNVESPFLLVTGRI